ncbi:hypothetical protein PINS_up000243 [Pythium insidiosum]|nr:hypothetical protein PINS_up000243 [Pythium insidiosum]
MNGTRARESSDRCAGAASATRATNRSSESHSNSYSNRAGSRRAMTSSLAATAAAAGASTGAAAVLSVKDIQRCFEKERRAFLRDLETLRQQLIKKEQAAEKAAAVASQHAIQLKKEIASLQTALASSERECAKAQEQFRHTSALLETALDQHQTDSSQLGTLQETIRTLERKHEDALAVVRREAESTVKSTHEERKALRARVDQLRCQLETERKEWQTVKRPLSDELDKAKVRLAVLEKELQQSRHREQSSFQLKEKAHSEALQTKRKVSDLATALQDALAAKSELKAEQQLMVKAMKDKWREVLRSYQHSKEQLQMLQEDYNGIFRTRQAIVDQNDRVCQAMRTLKARHEQELKLKDEAYWDLEKRFKRSSTTCSTCRKSPEQRQEELEQRLLAAQEQTRLAVAKELELERWDRFQELNSKYIETCEQLQRVRCAQDDAQRERRSLEATQAELRAKEQQLQELLARAEARVRELERKHDDEIRRGDEAKQQIQELMESIANLTTVASDQSKQLQEQEIARREEASTMNNTPMRIDRLQDATKEVDAARQRAEDELQALRERYDLQLDAYERLKQEKAQQWNDIVAAQLSANLLIEEQAHTIDNLLKAKLNNVYVSPSKASSASTRRPTSAPDSRLQQRDRESSAADSLPSASDSAPVSTPTVGTPSPSSTDGNTSGKLVVLQHECERLRAELSRAQMAFHREREELQSEYERKVVELMREVTSLQRQRKRLQRQLEEQAVTIHELTVQDDDNEDEDSGGDEDEDIDHEARRSPNDDVVLRRESQLSRRREETPPRRATVAVHPRLWSPESETHSTPSRRSTGARIPRKPSVSFKNMSQELSAIQPASDVDDDDENTTIGVSFLSGAT